MTQDCLWQMLLFLANELWAKIACALEVECQAGGGQEGNIGGEKNIVQHLYANAVTKA